MCWKAQNNSLRAAANHGKLGVVLFQMPSGFYYKEEHKEYLTYLRSKLLPEAEMAVEFRDASWLLPRHQSDTIDFLWKAKISLVSMDETVRLSSEYRKQQTRLESTSTGTRILLCSLLFWTWLYRRAVEAKISLVGRSFSLSHRPSPRQRRPSKPWRRQKLTPNLNLSTRRFLK